MGVEHFAHLDALEQIMTPSPFTLPASANAHEALRAMRESRIGCIIVTDDDNRPTGVMTTRDATRLLARQVALDTAPLESIMSRPVIHLEASRPVIEAARLMTQRHIRHVVVTRDGVVAGILSEHDIVRCLEHRYVDVLRHMIERQADEIESHRQLTAQGNLLDQLLSRTGELGVCQIEADGQINFANAAAYQLLGLPSDAHLSERSQLSALIDPDDRLRFDALFGEMPEPTPVAVNIGTRAVLMRAYRMGRHTNDGDDILLILVDEDVAAEAGEWLGFSRHAFGTMSLPMVWADTTGRVTMSNRAFDQLIGSEPDAPQTHDLFWLLDDASDVIGRCNQHNAAIRTKVTLRRTDGTQLPVELFFTHMQFRGDHYVGGFIHDLSHQMRVETALHDTEQQLSALLDTSPDFIAVKDPENRWQMANTAGLRMYGLENENWQGKSNEALADIASPHVADMLRRCSNTDQLAWARGQPIRYIEELPLVEGDGSRHLDMIKTPIFDDGDQPKALMVVGRDITERMRAERARREADGRLHSALAGMDDLMLIVNADRIVCDHYPKPAPARFQFDHGDLIGKRMDTLLPRPAAERLLRAQHDLEDGRGVQSFDFSLESTQETQWFNVRISMHKHLEGGSRGMTLMVRDFTASRRTTDALERLRSGLEERVGQRTAELEAALTELESFSYSLSHDLRAPLRAIAGFSRLLDADMAESLPPEGHDYLSRIRSAVGRMDALIDDMLDLARLSRKPLQRETVDLSHMAECIAEELNERAPERHVDWDIERGMTVSADPLLLHSVLDNLLGNAWKFTQQAATPKIRVFKRTDGNQTQFVVEDNGAGFDMNYADKLFQPFQRLHSPRDFEGSGIGLATVQRIINRHGGHIEGESPDHGGATFRFTLGN